MRTTKLLSIESPLVLRGARLLAYAVSIGFVLLFIYTALKRLRYPFELEKMESGMLTTVWRLAHGHPLYEKPSLEWAPFLYAPLFFYVSLAFTKLVGVSYTAIRLVSLLSTIGSMGVIYAFVLRETRRHGPAIFSIGFFACLYSTLLGWYDIGRVDSLSIFLLLLGLYATRFYHPLVAVIPWLLASQTKQGILAFAAVAFLTQWKRPGRMLVGLFTFVGLNFATIHLLNKYWDGWYNYYVFGTIKQLGMQPRLALLYVPMDIVQPMSIVLAILALALLVAPPRLRSANTLFYAIITFGIVGGTGFIRAHEGAWVNAVMPVYAWVPILFGIAVHRILAWSEDLRSSPGAAAFVPGALFFFISAQLLVHLYRPSTFDPLPNTLKARAAFLDQLRSTPGDVWLVSHSFDGILAGKPVHAEIDALDAVLAREDPATTQEIEHAYKTHHFTAVVLDHPPTGYWPPWLFNGDLFTQNYPVTLYAPAGRFVEGDQPALFYLPCSGSSDAQIYKQTAMDFIDSSRCQ